VDALVPAVGYRRKCKYRARQPHTTAVITLTIIQVITLKNLRHYSTDAKSYNIRRGYYHLHHTPFSAPRSWLSWPAWRHRSSGKRWPSDVWAGAGRSQSAALYIPCPRGGATRWRRTRRRDDGTRYIIEYVREPSVLCKSHQNDFFPLFIFCLPIGTTHTHNTDYVGRWYLYTNSGHFRLQRPSRPRGQKNNPYDDDDNNLYNHDDNGRSHGHPPSSSTGNNRWQDR